MKKYIFLTLIVMLSILPSHLKAAAIADPTQTSKTIDSPEANAIISRLKEIKALDKSSLSFKEKRTLRKEVRSLQSNLADVNGGVYISVGSIIIILLLLILLL